MPQTPDQSDKVRTGMFDAQVYRSELRLALRLHVKVPVAGKIDRGGYLLSPDPDHPDTARHDVDYRNDHRLDVERGGFLGFDNLTVLYADMGHNDLMQPFLRNRY